MRINSILLVAAIVGLLAIGSRAAPPDSPISWRATSEKPSLSDEKAREFARKYLGAGDIQPTSQQLVLITDRDELGNPVRDRVAYLTLFPSIPLERSYESQPEQVNLDVYVAVDATSGELLLAFTPARGDWVERTPPLRSCDELAEEMGFTLLPAPRRDIVSRIIDVLRAAFLQYGSKHVDAGQTVVRPRWVEQKFPARRVGDELVPTRPPAVGWLVHTMGDVLTYSSPPHGVDCSTGTPLPPPGAAWLHPSAYVVRRFDADVLRRRLHALAG